MTFPVVIEEDSLAIDDCSRTIQVLDLFKESTLLDVTKNYISLQFESQFPRKLKLNALIPSDSQCQGLLLVLKVVPSEGQLRQADDIEMIQGRVLLQRHTHPINALLFIHVERLDLAQHSFDGLLLCLCLLPLSLHFLLH